MVLGRVPEVTEGADLPSSPRLAFRRMDEDDLDDVARLLGDPVVMEHYPAPKSRDEATAWIRWNVDGYARDGFGLWLLHDVDGRFVGECGLTWQRVDGVEDLEIGYHLLPDRQGAGFATEAASACRDIARERGIERLIAIVVPENLPSRRVAEKVGLQLEKETTVHDRAVVVYAGRP